MSYPTAADVADPDPTSQITWPTGRNASGVEGADPEVHDGRSSISQVHAPSKRGGRSRSLNSYQAIVRTPGLKPLTRWNLFTLSLGMAGAQVAWTVELGYGTPFLLSLGLSEQLTSLVWLAGPISGLVAQPLIGAISDYSTSRYRRRFWIAWSTVVLVVSCLALAYAQDLASTLVDFFRAGVGDWDPKRRQHSQNVAIGIAITAFYLLDFSLNALQASLRNLLLDVTPPEQLSSGNAWHGRMTHAGNILGYGFGFLNLAGWPILRNLGGTQFRKFCVVGIVILVVTVWVTCWTQGEPQRMPNMKEQSGIRQILTNIYNAITGLPIPIRKVCFVQIFAFMAWFPFLFYATTYIGQVMARQDDKDPDVDVATRAGNFALLMYSLVAVVAGSLLPELTKRDERLLSNDEREDEEAEFVRIQQTVLRWKIEAAAKGKSLELPRAPLTLRNVWCFALVLYGVLSICTFFINTVTQATLAVALIGVCWAVAVWAPFAMIMEFLKEADEDLHENHTPSISGEIQSIRSYNRTMSSQEVANEASERTVLLGSALNSEDLNDTNDTSQTESVAGGTVLGIHNLAIVFPQFIIAIVASLIFRIVDKSPDIIGQPETIYLGKNGVAWVLRFGGLSAFVGAAFALLIPPTRQEKRMYKQLRKMEEARLLLLRE